MLHHFVVENLFPLKVRIKKMFGNNSVYLENKILLSICESLDHPEKDGIWISTSQEHHDSLQKQFPSLEPLPMINNKKWLLLPSRAPQFQDVANQICDLIKAEDPRIGVKVKG